MRIVDSNSDLKLFEEMFRQYYMSLHRFARRMIGDEVVAEDVVQDVFCALWNKRADVDFSFPIKSYLYRSVYNRSLNAIQERRSDIPLEDYMPKEEQAIYALMTQSNEMETQEMQRAISAVIDQLPERCKEIFLMSRVQNLKNKEISVKLSITVKAVEKQITKALLQIRNHLKKMDLMSIFPFII